MCIDNDVKTVTKNDRQFCLECDREIPPGAAGCPVCVIDLVIDIPVTPTSNSQMVEEPGRYGVGREHSRGGQGRLLLVHDAELNRDVIMKELLPPRKGEKEDSSSRRRASRFLSEAQVTGKLEHPSIVPVHEVGQREDGTLYYTMKYIRGKTLGEAIGERHDLQDRIGLLPYFVDLCQGVAYAHSRGVVHRDLKPQNVMIGEFGETVIVDWGLAKIITEVRNDEPGEPPTSFDSEYANQTIEGEIIGTPAFMSPEQAAGLTDQIDERSDVYALGSILYLILSGKRTFDWNEKSSALERILNEIPKSVSALEPNAPLELVAICERCLEKSPVHRFENAQELATEIERFQAGALVASYNYRATELIARFYRRHRIAMNSAIAAITAVLIGGVFAYFQIAGSRDEAIAARNDADNLTYVSQIRLAQAHLDAGVPDLAQATLHDTKESLRGFEWGFLLNRTDESRFMIDDSSDATLTRDGTLVATLTLGGPIRIWNTKDGSLANSFADGATTYQDVQFIGGNTVLVYDDSGNVELWEVDSGKIAQSWRISGEPIVSVSISPSGDAVLCAQSGGVIHRLGKDAVEKGFAETGPETAESVASLVDGEVFIFDGTTEEKPRALMGNSGWVREVHASLDGKILVTSCADSTVRIWDIDQLNSQETTGVIAENAVGADFAIQANRGIVIDENAVRVFNLQTGNVEGFIAAEMELRSAMADLSANGERVAIASNPYSIAVVDLPEFTRTDIDQGHRSRIDVLTISDDGHRVASATRDGSVNVWRSDGSRLVASHTNLDSVLSLAFDSTGEMLALGLASGDVLIWQLSQLKPKAAHHDHEGKVSHLEFSPDSGTLFSAGVKTSIVEFSVANRSVRQVIQKRRERLRGFVVDDKNNRIYASGYDKALYAWDLSSGSELINYSFFSGEVVGMGYDRDESELYAVNNNGELMKLNGR